MTMWMLVAIILINGDFRIMAVSAHTDVETCNMHRQYFMATAPQPQMNYESVCIPTNQLEVL